MDTEKILSLPKHHKKTFIALLVTLLIISVFLDFFLGAQPIKEVLLNQMRSITSAIITTLFALSVISLFIPQPHEKGALLEIKAQRITGEFDELLKVATRWRYKGNFGRYLRGKVLPTLAAKQNLHVSACIIDPSNQSLCEDHATYRSRINAIDKGKRYDADEVAIEVLVTIVIAAWYVSNKNVAIDIFLSQVFDPVRIDSNDEAMILTVEDRRSPALKITRNHFTYEHFELQMQTAREQARRIKLGGMRRGIELAELKESDIEAVLKEAEMTSLCARLSPKRILQACKQSKNPYAN